MYIFANGKTNLKNTMNMKKSLLTIIICAATMGVGYAQYAEGTVLQPTNVVAKRYDASGQLIKEMTSTYLYAEDGTLTNYDFPAHGLHSTYSYTDGVLVQEYTYHHGGHPYYDESFNYSYENCKLKNKTHLWGQMNASEYWLYSYNDEGQLERMDYKIEYSDDYHDHYLYEYEDGGRTKIESYWTSWVTQGLLLRKQTVYHYDEAFKLLTEHAESYSVEGELTKTTLKTYSYTPSGKEETVVTQTLTDGEWVNTSIVRYVFDGNDWVTERQAGEWSEENGDWTLTSKILYELDEETLTLTVSFYRKEGEEWVWDNYFAYNQPVFFEPYLVEQEHALRFHAYDDLFDSEYIGQFVFTMAEMNEPTHGVAEEEMLSCTIAPNPSNGTFTVAGASLSRADVFNAIGQHILTVTGEGDELRIDMQGQPAGIYFVNVTDAEGHKCVKRVVKE